MQQIYIRHDDGTYNILDIERQVSSNWKRSLELAEEYILNSNRPFREYWGKIANMDLAAVTHYIEKHDSIHVVRIIDTVTPYEFW